MQTSFEQQILHRRRVAGALIGALLFHAALGFLPFPRFSGAWGLRGGAGGGAARGLQDRFMAGALRGTEVAILEPPPPPPAAQSPAAARAQPAPEPVPEQPDAELAVPDAPEPETTAPEPSASAPTADAPAAGATTGAPGTSHRADAPGDEASGEGDPGGGLLPTGPIEMELGSPRLYVHPVNPEKVVRKRKIKDDVILHLLIGTDGLVRDVKVLRAIPNCDECTQNAVAAAMRQRYNPVTLNGRLVEVWTTLSFNFSYGK